MVVDILEILEHRFHLQIRSSLLTPNPLTMENPAPSRLLHFLLGYQHRLIKGGGNSAQAQPVLCLLNYHTHLKLRYYL